MMVMASKLGLSIATVASLVAVALAVAPVAANAGDWAGGSDNYQEYTDSYYGSNVRALINGSREPLPHEVLSVPEWQTTLYFVRCEPLAITNTLTLYPVKDGPKRYTDDVVWGVEAEYWDTWRDWAGLGISRYYLRLAAGATAATLTRMSAAGKPETVRLDLGSGFARSLEHAAGITSGSSPRKGEEAAWLEREAERREGPCAAEHSVPTPADLWKQAPSAGLYVFVRSVGDATAEFERNLERGEVRHKGESDELLAIARWNTPLDRWEFQRVGGSLDGTGIWDARRARWVYCDAAGTLLGTAKWNPAQEQWMFYDSEGALVMFGRLRVHDG
jgi:hypothetical protein